MSVKQDVFLDIRSGSVGAAIVERKKGELPRILYSTRKQVPLQKEFEIRKNLPITMVVVKKVLEELRSKHKHVSAIHVTIGSPWFTAQARTVSYAPNSVFKCTNDLLDKLLNDEKARFITDQLGGGDYKLVETDILQTKLNGYTTTEPVGKKANTLEVTFYMSAIDSSTSKSINEAVRSAYHRDVADLHTFSMLAQQVCTSMAKFRTNSYLLVDIGGEISELSVITGGVVMHTVSFPLGAHSIVIEIAKFFKTSIEEARSVYEAYKEGGVTVAVESRIAEAIEDVKVKWQTYTRGVLEKLSSSYILPRLVMVIGSPATEKIFGSVFEGPEVAQILGKQSVPEITYVTVDDLRSNYLEVAGRKPADIYLATEVVGVDSLLKIQ